MEIKNKKWVLKERPRGLVKDSDFELIAETLPAIQEGEILLENMYLSFDPTQRGWLNDVPGYLPPVQIGEVVRSGGMGCVIESKNPEYNVGDLVFGFVGWQSHCITKAEENERFRVIPPLLPIPTMLNVMGTTGITAYYGLLELGNPQPGETVLVSGAAGATGSVVVQIAKLKGCHVIAIAGGKEKCDWLKEVGADDVIDYKNSNVHEELAKIATNGIDIYFDNVGGDILETVLFCININARILLCGGISSGYDATALPDGPKNLFSLIIKRATMQGFLVLDYLPRSQKALEDIATWVMEGKLKHREDIQEGIENCPQTLNRLFTGENKGKQLLRIK
ncbi:NADP-dependent oxidoreductase [Gammaproteobacteria bacterium]|nr:NADP-dependent oxidoreductase [Gammaproteobacteria bacterium]MDB4210323.1 NADP-dependent oxidoreductase [Gammaproteobacteria bacterium]MDB9790923.1 NADP-dependent oxidoreductase [Gammaproteobacteria bacterium]MDC0014779.1 NADP-dependent oxidoreductase [Gammaproteobacteria bacterium]MDC1475676.1 NADP-dependent oxidoreductase [Gammaproteobacteria bacterium]